ncbi:hypothetical protein CQ017_13390 [Arthrobacter sp. MYb224]|uniref:hypothetical protein n=1 Tax=Arthrobacter sp. MYb224 TaxID=1848600 RepID=UPI000CFD6FC9|nr:hypothetical protein [Arthrobacter sp. MYb224]PQZ97744.1 hypothetical protein CQ017_13390 [Arthrobacter sp. MYb224]
MNRNGSGRLLPSNRASPVVKLCEANSRRVELFLPIPMVRSLHWREPLNKIIEIICRVRQLGALAAGFGAAEHSNNFDQQAFTLGHPY